MMPHAAEGQSQLDRQYLQRCLAQWDSWGCPVTFPGVPDGDRLAEEYVALVRKLVAEEK